MTQKGIFISLEGGEGCGKSTQLRLLQEALTQRFPDREIIFTRSPGGTPVAERIRTILKEPTDGDPLYPQTELFLFCACHTQMVRNLIRPAMERGAILVTDRFIDSTFVYQGVARGLSLDLVADLNRHVCGDTLPNLTILLDLDPEKGAARVQNRSSEQPATADRFDNETAAFHEKIRQGFLQLAKREQGRFAVIDAAQSIEKVHQDVMNAISQSGLK